VKDNSYREDISLRNDDTMPSRCDEFNRIGLIRLATVRSFVIHCRFKVDDCSIDPSVRWLTAATIPSYSVCLYYLCPLLRYPPVLDWSFVLSSPINHTQSAAAHPEVLESARHDKLMCYRNRLQTAERKEGFIDGVRMC